jgi:signal transduction histidine kinase
VALESAILFLNILMLMLILFVRHKEKSQLENEKELERLATLEMQIKSEAEIELMRMKESFLVMFTHELKTPLNAVLNFSKYISKNITDTKIIGLSNSIYKNGQNMLDTVNNLLEVNRVKNTKIEMKPEQFFLADMIRDILARYKILADEKSVKVDVNIDDDMAIVCNRFYIEHMISNIYTNAIKYGKGAIFISANASSNIKWAISIEDDGRGIADKELAVKLFEQAGEYEMQRSLQGTGVGLYFCKYFADLLGLELDISSSDLLGGAKITISKV